MPLKRKQPGELAGVKEVTAVTVVITGIGEAGTTITTTRAITIGIPAATVGMGIILITPPAITIITERATGITAGAIDRFLLARTIAESKGSGVVS